MRTAPSRETRPPARASRLALDFNTNRDKAFRRARGRTYVVRALRIILPVTAVALFGSYGIFVQRSVKISKARGHITIDAASISTEALIAHNPKYEGFDKQGGKFVVHAKTAEQDFGQKGPVRLKTIDGQMIDASKMVTDLTAHSGTLDTKTNVLELYERIEIVSQNGMTADLTRATVLTKEGRISSDEPVVVRLPTGTVTGNTMVIEQKQKQVTFDKGVKAHLKQERAKDKPVVAAKAGAGKSAEPFGASDAPVDITSTTLFIDDASKLAVFTGNVVAVQNDSTLQTAKLEVVYEGQAAPASATPPANATDIAARSSAKATGDPTAASRIKRLISRGDVILTRGVERATGQFAEFDQTTDRAMLVGAVVITSGPDRQATSDRADLDNKSDTSTLTGNVVVTQLKNVLRGRRLFIDRKGGTMAMSSPAEPGIAKGRIAARMYQADADAAKKTGNEQAKVEPAKAEQPKTAISAFTAKGDPNQPIDIDADTLDVSDKTKTATFRGAVHAVQGDYTIRTEELVITYVGDAGMTLGQTPAVKVAEAKPAEPKAKTAGTQLQKVQATRPVTVTTKDGRTVSGNTAEFDTKANVVTLVGDVLMSQPNSSVLRGPRARLDMTSGAMQMEHMPAATPGVALAPAERMQAVLFKQDTDKVADGKAKDGKDKDGKDKSGAVQAKAPIATLPAPVAAPASAPPRETRKESGGWSGDSSLFERMGQ